VKRGAERQQAQALLEFAIVVPLFLLLMLALIDFSRLLFTYISLTNSTREMARVAALSIRWNSSDAVDAFNNSSVIAGPQNPASDSATITAGDAACARELDRGASACTSGTSTTRTCSLPLQAQTCVLPVPRQDGFVQVDVRYTFDLNPLFQNRLVGVVDAFFLRPSVVLTTRARAYVE
jgi:TadE-like protein